MTSEHEILTLAEYQSVAKKSDQFGDEPSSLDQLRYGFFGEVGSLLASIKKAQRDFFAPTERESAEEELGDALWYLTALIGRASLSLEAIGASTVASLEVELGAGASVRNAGGTTFHELDGLLAFHSRKLPEPKDVLLYRLASITSSLFETPAAPETDSAAMFVKLLGALSTLAAKFGLKMSEIATGNIRKTQDRWPSSFEYPGLFDDGFSAFEQLPRRFQIDFVQRHVNEKTVVHQQLWGVNIGDPLTDNRELADGYRFHDVFHLAYIAHLGWSPVVRGLLKLKRKSNKNVDENQDGARAMIIEEGIATWIFNHAREKKFFENVPQGKLSYALLKQVQSMVDGYEVDACALWQWERAILDGFKVFRELQLAGEGLVRVDMLSHTIQFEQRAKVAV
jgi:NTP pyrophosphatase (non-canonical NTP hydrolase)